jgi:hypothetical protein
MQPVTAHEAQPLDRRPLAGLVDGVVGPEAIHVSRYSTSTGSRALASAKATIWPWVVDRRPA